MRKRRRHPNSDLLVVKGVVPTAADTTNLWDECWSFALDQRAFGPRRLLVAFAERDGRLLGLAHTRRTTPPEHALAACIDYMGRGAAAAIAYCDEPATPGPPEPGLLQRFESVRAVGRRYGVDLVDWIMCDDQNFRSLRLSFGTGDDPWAAASG